MLLLSRTLRLMETLTNFLVIAGFILTIASILIGVGGLREQLHNVISTLGDADSGLVKKVNQHETRIAVLEGRKQWNQPHS